MSLGNWFKDVITQSSHKPTAQWCSVTSPKQGFFKYNNAQT